jgi:tripartite-type tricarboxylate transporter receptor subunit TctC
MTAWFSLVAPKDTPPAVTDTLRKALQAALKDTAVRQRLLDMGIEPGDGSAEALANQIRTESPVIDALVKRANIAVQ